MWHIGSVMTENNTEKSFLELPPGAKFIATGIGFTEGPAVFDNESVVVTSINRGYVYRVPLDGSGPEPLVETGGGPNGLAMGADGEVWITQNGGTAMPSRSKIEAKPSLQRWKRGQLDTVLDTGVHAPSDCVIGPDGRLWFTDTAEHGVGDDIKPGRLHTYDAADGRLVTQRSGLMFPNGLAFGVDQSELYVAETATNTIRRYRIHDDSCVPDGWVVRLPTTSPDGMAVDREGWLWVAGGSGDNVIAIDHDGFVRQELTFGVGVMVTSLCFAGVNLETLVVTVAKGGSVVAIPAVHPGLPLPVFTSGVAL